MPFAWQLLDWPIPESPRLRMVLTLEGHDHIVPASGVFEAGRVEALPPGPVKSGAGVPTKAIKGGKFVNHAARNEESSKRGRAGELLVVEHERTVLIAAGRQDLAAKIVHVADMEGDGAGYDVRSFHPDGREKCIEVKTTRGPVTTDFFMSANEVAFSRQNPDRYVLYRLYGFNDQANSATFFQVAGDVTASLALKPTEYRVSRLTT